ncbi:MAG: alpha-galactosidase [Culicoidibacterales bacterium]
MGQIFYEASSKQFHIQGENVSYIMHVLPTGELGHLYYGKYIEHHHDYSHQFARYNYGMNTVILPLDESAVLDSVLLEYPTYGTSDFRQPAIEVLQANGSRITKFTYDTHTITNKKSALAQLPSSFASEADVQTLTIELVDPIAKLRLILTYTLFETGDVITRHAVIQNEGTQAVQLLRFLSMNLDMSNHEYELMTFTGTWIREQEINSTPLRRGIQSISSTRGASSATANPFFILKGYHTTDHHGEAYGFNLLYSGNHVGQVEMTPYDQIRIQQGMNYFDFNWELAPNTNLQSPEVALVYTDNGLNKLTQIYHDFYREHVISPNWSKRERPILINNWEATYFDFDEKKLLALAQKAKDVGIELFVLDDGWFGHRDSDNSSLGDWYHDPKKLPHGLKHLVDQITDIGLQFGLWIEPEMVSPDSEFYRNHPEWIICVSDRQPTQGRNQYVLDFTNNQVVDTVYEMIAKVIRESGEISYIKWDWNRPLTEIGSLQLPAAQQQEVAHRYVLGLYRFYDRLVKEFPDILIEGCASGGSRFDGGILAYSPQIWASDDSDAVERLKIQYGTSFCYPLSTIGAHVSATPNHQVQRTTSLKMRGDVAFFGILGYELDLTVLSEQELAEIAAQIKKYKSYRKLILTGDFSRILSPYDGTETAWSLVDKAQTQIVVGYYRTLAKAYQLPTRLKIPNLNPKMKYQLKQTSRTYSGYELMNWGIELNLILFSELDVLASMTGDHVSLLLEFEQI